MKKNFGSYLSILAIFITSSIMAQSTPDAVVSAFKNKYPDARSVKWEKDSDGYEVEFKMNGKEMEALFSASGKWIETETEISVSDIPEAVRKSIDRSSEGYKIKEVEKLESAQYGSNLYEVELKKDDGEIEVIFDKQGKILKKETEEDDDESDDD